MQKYHHLYGAETKNKRATGLHKGSTGLSREITQDGHVDGEKLCLEDFWVFPTCRHETCTVRVAAHFKLGSKTAQFLLNIPNVQG